MLHLDTIAPMLQRPDSHYNRFLWATSAAPELLHYQLAVLCL
jgi:hypothetical protein